MSILVKMDMPDACCACPFEDFDIYNDEDPYICTLGYIRVNPAEGRNKRPDKCPLVEVKPHGRLIDADELLKRRAIHRDEQGRLTCLYDIGTAEILRAPTIIPAEESET